MRKPTFAAAGVAVGLAITGRAATADEEANLALRYCDEMATTINTLVDYTSTKCFPGQGSNGMEFIFLSSRPVFSTETAKKGWLIVVVGTFGKMFNGNDMKTQSVIVSDISLMKQRQAYRIPSRTARGLQQSAYDGDIELEEMYSGILAAMEPFSVPE